MDSSFKENTCVVCFHNISIYAVGDCDHYDRICYICSTRLRVLCNKYECPICRKDIPKVIFSKHKQPYGALSKIQYPMDYKYKIAFADVQVREDYETLLEHPCHKCHPDKRVFRSFGHLKDHIRKEHELFFCELCVENLNLFTHERRCYTRKELGTHRRVGDTDDTSHRGHPSCQFCEERYMDKDELFRHLRKEHYYCHFCDESGLYQFYGDYQYLRDHFREEHFLCEEGDCREEQFTGVFRSQIDLKAHRATQHCKNMNKQQAKQARTLELEFTITPRTQQQNAESYEGSRRGRKGPGGARLSRETSQQQPARSRENDFEEEGLFSFFGGSEPAPNTKCQKQFPQLGDGHDHPDGKVSVTASASRPYGRNYNPQSEEDFPTLIGAPSTTRNNNMSSARVTVSQPSMPSANSVLFKINNNNKEKGGGSGNISIQVSSKTKAKPPMSNEDFPSLSTRVKNTNVPIPQPEPKKQPIVTNKHKTDQEVNGWSSSNSPPTNSNFEAEFPNLVGKSNGMQQMGRSTLTIPVGGSSWSKTNSTKVIPTENKKPQEAESAYTVMKGKAKKSSKNGQSVTAPKTKENNNNNNNKKKEESRKVEVKYLEETSSLKNNSESDALTKKTNPPNNNEISLNTKIDKSPPKPKICAEEFPPLPSEPKLPPVPPGFSSKTNRNANNPPPGFQSCTMNKTITALTLSSVAKQLLNPSPPPLDTITVIPKIVKATYIEPDNFEDRNRTLITKIRDILNGDDEAFSNFKHLSGQFRQGMVQAREYYDKCISIFGKDKFLKVLPELLVLLPDISKEQELLTVFNQVCKREGKSSGAVPKASTTTNIQNCLQLLVCATCQQVLTTRDFQKHMLAHNEEGLFPPLAGNAETATAHITWVKK